MPTKHLNDGGISLEHHETTTEMNGHNSYPAASGSGQNNHW